MKYKIDHYLIADKYVPMVKFSRWSRWRFIVGIYQYNHIEKGGSVTVIIGTGNDHPEAVTYTHMSYDTIEIAERAIKIFHEWKTKSTVVSLDVKISEALLEKKMDRINRFNNKYKTIK